MSGQDDGLAEVRALLNRQHEAWLRFGAQQERGSLQLTASQQEEILAAVRRYGERERAKGKLLVLLEEARQACAECEDNPAHEDADGKTWCRGHIALRKRLEGS